MGSSLISFKNERWRGRSTLATSDRGERSLVRIKNGLVSSDGREIRSFPGWRCLFDFSADNNGNGYDRYTWDTVLPIYSPFGGIVTGASQYEQLYREAPDYPPTPRFSLQCRAKPIHFHFFEMVDDVLIIGGETRFRECPIPDSPGTPWLTITRAGMIINGTDQQLILTFDAAVGGFGGLDNAYNGIAVNDVCFIDGITVTGTGSSGGATSLIQAALDANVNGRCHKVQGVVGNSIRFFGDRFSVPDQEDWAVDTTDATPECHRIRSNYDDDYGATPQGITPYDGDEFGRIDDPDALTSWRTNPELPFSISNSCSHTVYPAYVANRQRDHSDDNDRYIEGIQPTSLSGSQSGISRREQRRLPYRMVPELAGNRIIIAAPGYNCLFQIPLMHPTNPQNWPATPTAEGLGQTWFENDIYDKPRALGVPKARLIDSIWTPAPTTPGESLGEGINFLVTCTAIPHGSTLEYTWPAGTFRMCVTYYDDVTGEEGAPSEIIEFTVPVADTPDDAFAVRLAYFHPGYVMPECLAMKMRIYLSDIDSEILGYYKTIPLTGASVFDKFGMHGDNELGSAKYGFFAGSSPATIDSPGASGAEWRVTHLPIPFASPVSTIGGRIDFSRPPLQSNSMPRGANSVRYIRGTLISVGHAGVDEASVRTWPGWGSMIFDPTLPAFDREDEFVIRIHDGNLTLPADSRYLAGFGTASRFFPDAYQGIFIHGNDLLFTNREQQAQIDKIVNRRVFAIDSPDSENFQFAQFERIKTVGSLFDSDLRYTDGIFQSIPGIAAGREYGKDFFYKMFKGQIQVGDPGNPWRVSKAGGRGIQFMDPNKDDDGVAVFQFNGNAVICSRKETWFFSWHRDAAGEIPKQVHSDFGCIAPNAGVEFDGGLVWLSERGPVALGASLQHVGLELEDDFTGDSARYLTDSKGMMRHASACHDQGRGQVYFPLITTDATHTVPFQMGTVVVTAADDETLSRAPCNEILCWSYRTGGFTYWTPPAGLEVLWMRPIRVATDSTGNSYVTRIAMLNADGRVRILDDQWQDENKDALETTTTNAGTDSTAMSVSTDVPTWGLDGDAADLGKRARQSGEEDGTLLLRVGMVVQAFDSDDNIEWETTLAAASSANATFTLDAAQTWVKNQTIRVGVRPSMEIETTFVGSESPMNLTIDAVQMRYTLHGEGKANADCTLLKSDLDTGTVARSVKIRRRSIGEATSGERHSRRRELHGKAAAPEMAVKLVVSSEPQVRIADIALEI